jgi:ligand-binding SRPBCC domain-containing protein
MTKTYHLHREQIIRRPLDEVFAFFSDAGNLQEITPPFLNFGFVTKLPIEMKAGAVIDYRLALFKVPIKWRTVIKSYDPPESFIDTQVRGPYKLWHHTHTFREVTLNDGSTAVEMHDDVNYQIPLGPLGRFAHWLFVRRMLDKIFDYRYQRIEELLPSNVSFKPHAKNAVISPVAS